MNDKHIAITPAAAEGMLEILDATNKRPLLDYDLVQAELLADILREALGITAAPSGPRSIVVVEGPSAPSNGRGSN